MVVQISVSEGGVARRSCSAGLPVLLLLFTQSDSTALEARDNISIYSIAPIPFISKEALTWHGTDWMLRGMRPAAFLQT